MTDRTGMAQTFSHSGCGTDPCGVAEYNGLEVTVIRQLTEAEADLVETGPMYQVVTDDGARFDVFEHELGPAI